MNGPSLPTGMPAIKAAIKPNCFAIPVFKLRYLGIEIPAMIALISGMPEPSTSRLTKTLNMVKINLKLTT